MAVTDARVRKLALAFEGASAAPHFDRTAFRTPRKTFATLGRHRDLNLMFNPDLRDHFCALAPDVFRPVEGGWGRMGATRCDLDRVDEPLLGMALTEAHALAKPLPRKSVRKTVRRTAAKKTER